MKAFWDSKIQVFDGKWNIDENTFVLVRREELVFFILELLFHFLVFGSTHLEIQVNFALLRVAYLGLGNFWVGSISMPGG